MIKLLVTITVAALLVSNPLRADFVGLEIGASSWTPDYEGNIKLDGASAGDTIDIQNDLGFDDESHSDVWVRLEHPVPVLPNLKFVSSDLDASASSTLSRNISYGNTSFNASADINTRFDMTNTDMTLYYELLDNWVNFDFGLTLRQYDGQSRISSNGTSEGEDLDFTVPLLYLDARFDLPFTGFFVDSTMNTLSVSDNSISDVNVAIGYESDFGLGARVGYRTLDLEADESDLDVDLKFKGTYLNLFYHF